MTDPLGMQRFALKARESPIKRFTIRIGKVAIRSYAHAPLAVTGLFDRIGQPALSDLFLAQLFDLSPYNWALGERLADRYYDTYQRKYAIGTVDRGRFLLSAMRSSVPSEQLIAAYFENLGVLMRDRPARSTPGQLVLGIGSGRTGSTTLAALLASASNSISTHENPPLVYWEPHPRQVSFHIRRIAVLLNHFSLVADAASWWINLLEPVRRAIPTVKVIALVRDTEDCVRSFDRAVEQNPWAGPWKRTWENRRWDLIMPHYPVPADVAGDPRAAKQAMIRQYVTDYNALISDLQARRDCDLLIVRTEALSSPSTIERISGFIGMQVSQTPPHFNAGGTDDGASLSYRF